MPEIFELNGMSIKMLYRDHDDPHVHIYRHDIELAVVQLDGTLRNGNLEPDKLKVLRTWMKMKHEELMVCWLKASKGLKPGRIKI
ncbi:MAG: DUF4160 domain-containing protein [Ignavibacteriaceae bacterium]|nr:DUF4160 domain-containing protein [Ignavibacteriaceae bacterium]